MFNIDDILSHFGISQSNELASGSFGTAYNYGSGLILKITKDSEGAIFANNIKHKKFERISEVQTVYKIKSENLFIIILEKLQRINDEDINEILRYIHIIHDSFINKKGEYLNFKHFLEEKIKEGDWFNPHVQDLITTMPIEKIIWTFNEYDAVLNELNNAKGIPDGFSDVHGRNMGLKNGKLAVYDIRVSDYKEWKINKIKSFKMNENLRKNIRSYFRFTLLKENLEQDIVDYNRKNIQKIYSENAGEIFTIIMSYPEIWLKETGIETLLNFLQKEDSMNFRLQHGMTTGNPVIFKSDEPKREEESEIDYILRINKIKYDWKEIKNRLIQYFIQGLIRNMPRDRKIETKEEFLKFLNTYKEAFLYGYIEVMAKMV